MEMPSFASSPCTRGAPQRGLALLMFRISSRISGATPGRPGLRRRLFQVQYRLNPQRCQRMTVSGFTMTRTLSQSVQILRNSTQNPRSTFERRGRFTERRRMAICCRRATFSRASLRRALKAEMIEIKKIESATAAIFKLLLVAEKNFRRLNAPELMREVYLGVRFQRWREGVVFYIESRRFLIRDSPRPATTYEQKTGGADGVKGA